MRPDIVQGARLPDYELADHTSTTRRLSELQGDDPMILTLSRGLSTPGLRQRWDKGDYEPFHGWNRRAPHDRPAIGMSK